MAGQENLVEVRPGLLKRSLGALTVLAGTAIGGAAGNFAGSSVADRIVPEEPGSFAQAAATGIEVTGTATGAVIAGAGTYLLKNVFWFETEHIYSDDV